MKQGDLLRVELCGPESNPKKSGYYDVKYSEVPGKAYYSFGSGWYETIALSREVFPRFWLKPVGKTEEDLQEEAFRSAYKLVIGALSSLKWNNEDEEALKNAFSDYRSEYLKQ